MKIPIVMVHGIGKLKKDTDGYFKSWRSHNWDFEPVFYNASWHPYAFNVVGGFLQSDVGFRDLCSFPKSVRAEIPLMIRLAYYGAAKLRALTHYAPTLPFWKRAIASSVDYLAFRLMGVEVLDFVGDILAYIHWEDYTIADSNPIRDAVRAEIERALAEFPDRPVHIVCHSLGTKVVWDVLQDMKSDLPQGRIGLLMTLGSPLQPLAIFDWVRPEDNTAYVKPGCVDHWLNVYDVRDPIGAPIGSPAFKRRAGAYMDYVEALSEEYLPCANVCAPIGLFPWSAHTRAFKAPSPKKLFSKYVAKYL